MPDFIAVLIRPRATMRRILDQRRYRWIPLVVLAVLASSIHDIKPREFLHVIPAEQTWMIVGIIAAVICAGLAICLLLFYGLSWITYFVGRTFDGTGEVREVRAATAWGLMPLILSAVYRVPLAFWLASQLVSINPMACGTMAIVGAAEILTLVWYAMTASACLAEAHRFSFLRGLATLAFTWLTPLILTLAAVLSLT